MCVCVCVLSIFNNQCDVSHLLLPTEIQPRTAAIYLPLGCQQDLEKRTEKKTPGRLEARERGKTHNQRKTNEDRGREDDGIGIQIRSGWVGSGGVMADDKAEMKGKQQNERKSG